MRIRIQQLKLMRIRNREEEFCSVKGIRLTNPLPLPLPQFPCFLLGRHTSQMTSSHLRWGGGGVQPRMRGPAGEEVETPKRHSMVCCPARPLRNDNVCIGNSPQKVGGWGAQRRAKKVGREGGHGPSRAEVEIRLVRVLRGASRFSGSIPNTQTFFLLNSMAKQRTFVTGKT